MCGVVACLGSAGSRQQREAWVARMLDTLVHRGPDGRGIVCLDEHAVLGHQRLAVIDPESGQQPMCSADGRYALVFNGEIYNYRELRHTLIEQGASFKTRSDTEVLLQLLIREGVAALTQLNGMFAFVFVDRVSQQWIAARDPFGIKPLYMTHTGQHLLIASEIKALLEHPQVTAVRDDHALEQYLAFQFCLDDQTLFHGVRKFKPGHYVIGRGDQVVSTTCYWDTNYRIDTYHTEAYFTDHLQQLLDDAMRLQLRSDVPVGSYLSGGLDSSLVSVLAARQLEHPIAMFHGRFSEGSDYDESRYARDVVEQIGGTLFDVVPTPEQFVNAMPQLIYAMDEPVAGPGLFPQFMVSQVARQNVTVVLGGQGGDEIFGGYARYLVGYLEQALKGAIFETQEEGKHLVTLESIVPHLSLLKSYGPLLTNFWQDGLFDDMDRRYFRLIDRSQGLTDLISPELQAGFDRDALFQRFQAIFNHPDTRSYINKMTHFDQKTLLPALLQVEDRVSMAVSLESRVPLLDTRIVDLVTSMPPPLKFQGGRTKHILKKAVREWLPTSILTRKDKMGFPVPLSEWMAGGCVRDFVSDVLLSQRSVQRGIYTPRALRAMLDQQGVGARQLWGALSLELWHQRFIDG